MKYLDELKRLDFPIDKFAIFGSGPLAIRGLREIDDLDIIVKPDLWNVLRKKYLIRNEKIEYIKIGNIEIYKEWSPWFDDINQLIDEADIIDGFRFVKLKRVLEWKKAFNREKDKKDIELINNYLDSIKKSSDRF